MRKFYDNIVVAQQTNTLGIFVKYVNIIASNLDLIQMNEWFFIIILKKSLFKYWKMFVVLTN